jgi:hypothetical protein
MVSPMKTKEKIIQRKILKTFSDSTLDTWYLGIYVPPRSLSPYATRTYVFLGRKPSQILPPRCSRAALPPRCSRAALSTEQNKHYRT